MTESIREYLPEIVAFLLELLIFLVIIASIAWTRGRIQNELQSDTRTVRFSYPPGTRWLMAIGVVFFGLAAPMSAILPESIDAWIPLLFLGVTILCAYIWYYLSGDVLVDRRGVTLHKLFARTRIEYSELEYLSNHKAGGFIALHAPGKRIRVEHQLLEYEAFLELVRRAYWTATGVELQTR